MSNRLKEIIKGIVKEIQDEKDLEEATGTGAVAGYDTPAAFSGPGQTAKKNKRLASVSGGEVVDDLEEAKILNLKQKKEQPVAVKDIDDADIADISGMEVAVDGLHLAENRWLALKKEDGSPKAKISRGITSIHNQLTEVEKFVNWYSKLKTENGLKKEDYYKRTNKSLYKIKERLMNLSEKIRGL